MHIDDLRLLAPLWLHKTEEVRADKAHWATEITGDVYGHGWISEMYGYSFGAAEVSQLSFNLENIDAFEWEDALPLLGIDRFRIPLFSCRIKLMGEGSLKPKDVVDGGHGATNRRCFVVRDGGRTVSDVSLSDQCSSQATV